MKAPRTQGGEAKATALAAQPASSAQTGGGFLESANDHAQGLDETTLLPRLREWAAALGFSQIGVADVDLSSAEPGLLAWLHNGFHGAMDYMARHGLQAGAAGRAGAGHACA